MSKNTSVFISSHTHHVFSPNEGRLYMCVYISNVSSKYTGKMLGHKVDDREE
jgi:hypothetical protein